RIYKIEKKMYGRTDLDFLAKIFNRCLLYFTWWVNRKDADGNNLFQGGFLGLDNIGLFDRNQVPAGTTIYQADASSWMGLFSLLMIKIAMELAKADDNMTTSPPSSSSISFTSRFPQPRSFVAIRTCRSLGRY